MYLLVRFAKKLFKCGICKDSYYFGNKYLIFRGRCKCADRFKYDELKYIIYTVVGNSYFIDVVKKDQNDCMIYKTLIDKGVKIDSSGDQIKEFVNKCNSHKISIVPTVKVCGIPFVDNINYSILSQSFLKRGGLLHIVRITDEWIIVGGGYFSWNLVKIEHRELFELLESYSVGYDHNASKDKRVSFWVELLDISYTLGRGYGLYPMLNGEIVLTEIYYSFDKKKIVTKTIELFEKYSSKRNP